MENSSLLHTIYEIAFNLMPLLLFEYSLDQAANWLNFFISLVGLPPLFVGF